MARDDLSLIQLKTKVPGDVRPQGLVVESETGGGGSFPASVPQAPLVPFGRVRGQVLEGSVATHVSVCGAPPSWGTDSLPACSTG